MFIFKHVSIFEQDIINHLRAHSHATTYATSMPAPVAQQVITSMSIIMGKDGTNEGVWVDVCVCVGGWVWVCG